MAREDRAPSSCLIVRSSYIPRISKLTFAIARPNHEEFLSFYSHPKPDLEEASFRPELEGLMRDFLRDVGVGAGDGVLVVRCGGMGCCIGTSKGLEWFPAFFQGENKGRVKDVTGGKSVFIHCDQRRHNKQYSRELLFGRIRRRTSSLQRRSVRRSVSSPHPVLLLRPPHSLISTNANTPFFSAALYATVSASFVVEQLGLPELIPYSDRGSDGGGDREVDLWNGEDPQKRLEELRWRIKGEEQKEERSNGIVGLKWENRPGDEGCHGVGSEYL